MPEVRLLSSLFISIIAIVLLSLSAGVDANAQADLSPEMRGKIDNWLAMHWRGQVCQALRLQW